MAYAWTAQYGYYSDATQTAEDINNLDGFYFNDSHFHFSTPKTLYTIPESLTLPAPTNSRTRVDLDTAMSRSITLTEWNYITVIPYCHSDVLNRLTHDGYIKWEMTFLELCGGALYYSLGLIEDAFSIRNTKHSTWVYLNDINILIDWQGAVYTVNPDTALITRVIAPGFYFKNTLEYTTEQADNPFHYHDCQGHAYFVFIYDGGFYQNGIDIIYAKRNVAPNDEIKEYIIFNDGNYRSTQTNNLINYLIGTPDDPKYKYKTDPANPETDPYIPPLSPLNPSGPGGGEGTHNIPTTQPTPIPTGADLPNPSALGLYHLYNPSSTQLAALGMELYGLGDSDLKLISRMVNSPMEALLSVHCLPYSPSSSGSVPVQLGHYTATATAAVCTYDHEIIDCGNLKIDKIWGSYLDYNMSVSLYLPFVGFIPLKPDDVIGKTLNVNYIIDNATGSFCAYVIRADDSVVLGTFGGNCSYQIPLTATNYSEIIHAVTGLAASAISGGAALATGGLAAPIAAGIASSALNVATSKKHYETAGGLGTNTGFMGVRVPYIKVMVPNACVPKNQNKYKGYPSYMTKRIGDLSGYTEVDAVHLEMLPATPSEIDEIRRRLSEGVYL